MAEADKRSPGEPFKPPPAGTWNSMIGAAEEYERNQLSRGAPTRSRPRSTDIIKCKNGSGAARARGEVLGTFTKTLTNLEAGNIQLVGAAPTAGKHFGILLKVLPNGEYGELQLSGVCPATVTVSDITHQYADIDPGAYKLISAESGPVAILWQPGSTGDQECFVRLGGGGASVACTPTTYITALQVTATAIQYKSYDVATCTESGWTTLATLEDCTA